MKIPDFKSSRVSKAGFKSPSTWSSNTDSVRIDGIPTEESKFSLAVSSRDLEDELEDELEEELEDEELELEAKLPLINGKSLMSLMKRFLFHGRPILILLHSFDN